MAQASVRALLQHAVRAYSEYAEALIVAGADVRRTVAGGEKFNGCPVLRHAFPVFHSGLHAEALGKACAQSVGSAL